MAQYEGEGEDFHAAIRPFLESLPYHLWLEDGALVVAHAGVKPEMLGRTSPAVRSFGLYGDTSGKLDSDGLPVRFNWAADYRGSSVVVYGHTPVEGAEWQGNTICVDTACVYGNKLAALRWPEREIVTVPARETYAELRRPRSGCRRRGHRAVPDRARGWRSVCARIANRYKARPDNTASAAQKRHHPPWQSRAKTRGPQPACPKAFATSGRPSCARRPR